MGKLLENLERAAEPYIVARDDSSLILSGSGEAFDKLVRQAIETAGDEFVALPVGGATGYERLVILPLAP